MARALISDDLFESLELHPHTVYTVSELLAPLPMPPAILGIGLNYWGHINASGLTAPK